MPDYNRDVRPFFDSVKLSIAPLRFGAGVKGKINQSMAFGVPVVATSIAAEGMELKDHEDILLADKPEEFAEALVELYESEALWNRLSENGIRKTQALYSTDVARKKLEFLFSDDHLASLRKKQQSQRRRLLPQRKADPDLRVDKAKRSGKNHRKNQCNAQPRLFRGRLRSDLMGNQ